MHFAGEIISYITYADGVALMASTGAGLQALLDALVKGASAVGLQLGPAKCMTLKIIGDH
ncbi:hypothetical protein E2C01_058410 [Portunus trituberculatus]|uniref:Reverse transcriptase domain-containing protein n=1 Tax=Portunus trituberculatus TaxID=210409 RepID=A0A5B7H5A0_PORTR|nr:hypothetical protein [Portunus trituberculatus]